MSQEDAFCSNCGAPLQAGVASCPRCGFAVSPTPAQPSAPTAGPQTTDWREMRHQEKAQRRMERRQRRVPGVGLLVVASILIVAGLGVFFPELPWQFFWASLLVLLGIWVVGLWVIRNRRYGPAVPR